MIREIHIIPVYRVDSAPSSDRHIFIQLDMINLQFFKACIILDVKSYSYKQLQVTQRCDFRPMPEDQLDYWQAECG